MSPVDDKPDSVERDKPPMANDAPTVEVPEPDDITIEHTASSVPTSPEAAVEQYGSPTDEEASAEMRPTLNMPAGTIRAFLALGIAAASYTLIARDGASLTAEADLLTALMLVLGYYFGVRSAAVGYGGMPAGKKNPLWLPAGMVRLLLVMGFVGVVAYLWFDKGPSIQETNPDWQVIVAIGLFFIGRLYRYGETQLLSKGKQKVATVFQDIKGGLGIIMGLMVFVVFASGFELPESFVTEFKHIFPPLVTFYFGSK